MSIVITEVRGKDDLRRFIKLPSLIHRGHKNWVPPLYSDEWRFFDPGKNEAFGYSDTKLLLAYKDGKLAGRIMGIINRKYNALSGDRDCRFAFLETWDDYAVAEELLKAVEDWGKGMDMNRIVGPLGFSDKDPQGLLIDGFDKPIVIASNCNYPYLVDFVERAGYRKKLDLVVYQLKVPGNIPSFYTKIYERAMRNNPDIRVLHFRNRIQLRPYIRPVLELVNRTFEDIYAFSPLTDKEMKEYATRYLPVLSPSFIKVIENRQKEVVAFILAMPDISEGIIRSGGHLWPTGFIHILRSQRRTRQLNLLLGAIREDYRNKGLDSVLGIALLEEARKAGMEVIDSHLEMESNLKMRAEMEKMGGQVYKTYRIFCKELSGALT